MNDVITQNGNKLGLILEGEGEYILCFYAVRQKKLYFITLSISSSSMINCTSVKELTV